MLRLDAVMNHNMQDLKISIKTMDNPGWLLKIELKDTDLENQCFQDVKIERTDNDWLFCGVKNQVFEGVCGPANLSEVLKIFHNWASNFSNKEIPSSSSRDKARREKDELTWLQHWFYIHCNGDWEHTYGIELSMCNHSSYMLKIDLEGTELEDEVFYNTGIMKGEEDWVDCDVKSKQFVGTFSPTNCDEVIQIFRDWAVIFLGERDRRLMNLLETKGLSFIERDDFAWLQAWYYIHCNGTWELMKRIHLETLENAGWLITINVKDTELETADFRIITILNSQNDWLGCEVKNKVFQGQCGPFNLPDVLKVFRNWSKPRLFAIEQ